MDSVADIMQRADAEGREPSDDELRAAVSRTVAQGVIAGLVVAKVRRGERPAARPLIAL